MTSSGGASGPPAESENTDAPTSGPKASTGIMEQLGDYLIHRLIGEGGMGKVFEAEERLSRRRVALKVLHPDLAKREEGRRLFTNEMQILAQLEHPNIVRSLASTEVDGELVMVLEYLDGETLRSVLSNQGALPWSEAVAVVLRVAAALSAAHGKEPAIIHRDLKPENIMVLADGTVKVMDFGIAKVVEAINQTNTQSVGTLQYMSPEQIDAHTIDHRSDLYCLGLIFYEMLAGKPPFSSSSPRQLLNQQCTEEPPALPADVRASLPKGVEQLVFELLEKAPEDRPYFAEDVIERLSPFESAGPPSLGRRGADAVTGPGRASPGLSTGRRRSGANEGVEPERKTPAQPSDATSTKPSVTSEATPKPPQNRADTIELVERAAAPRELPTMAAIAIIVLLSLLAGAGAYLAKATSTPDDAPDATSADDKVDGKERDRGRNSRER